MMKNHSVFNIMSASVSSLSVLEEKNGFLFLFKVTGEIEMDFDGVKKCIKAKKTACLPLDKIGDVADKGTTAYFTVSGTLCNEIMHFYSLGYAYEEFFADAETHFFDICLAGDGNNEGEIVLAFHKLCMSLASSRAKITPEKSDVAEEIRAFLDGCIYRKIMLDEVKDVFFISRSQMFRTFKGRYDISPVQYLIEKKIGVAKTLMQNEDMRISDIAEKLCFSDAKHFSKAFKGVTGELPRDFKRKLKQVEKQKKSEK